MPIFELLVEVGDVVRFVKVHFSELLHRYVELVGDFFHVRLCDEHALWTAEAAKCGIGYSVRLRYSSSNMDIWDHITILNM